VRRMASVAEGVDVVETMNDAVKGAVSGWAEVGWVNLVDDGALPPEVGVMPEPNPAGRAESAIEASGAACGERAGETEEEKRSGSSVEGDHALVIEMLARRAWKWWMAVYGRLWAGFMDA